MEGLMKRTIALTGIFVVAGVVFLCLPSKADSIVTENWMKDHAPETVADYRQTVLIAFAEVEDNLAALRVLEEEARLQQDALEAAQQSLQLTLNQYKAGIVSYLNVLTAQTTLFAAERTSVDLRNRRLAASVALVRALGGGWRATDELRLRLDYNRAQ